MSILREATLEKHKQVEALPFIQYLMHGTVTKENYIIYLAEMLAIYEHLEYLANNAGLFADIEDLPRAEKMKIDLEELSPNHQTELSPSTEKYLEYLTTLFHSDRQNQLFAHIYVRHLGDMYGGKVISKKIPGSGNWYKFENRGSLNKRFTSKLYSELADEALVAFGHFEDIFQDLYKRIDTRI